MRKIPAFPWRTWAPSAALTVKVSELKRIPPHRLHRSVCCRRRSLPAVMVSLPPTHECVIACCAEGFFFFRALTFNPGKHVPLSSGKRGRAFRQAEAGAATAAFHWSISNSSELLRTFEAKLENNVHRCFWFVFQPRRATCVMQPLNLLVRGSNAASLISICL